MRAEWSSRIDSTAETITVDAGLSILSHASHLHLVHLLELLAAARLVRPTESARRQIGVRHEPLALADEVVQRKPMSAGADPFHHRRTSRVGRRRKRNGFSLR
jgi:hypothetical protein